MSAEKNREFTHLFLAFIALLRNVEITQGVVIFLMAVTMTEKEPVSGPRVPVAAVSEAKLPPQQDGEEKGDKSRGMLRGVIKTLRPHQWVKNLFVLAPMFFAKDLVSTNAQGTPTLRLDVPVLSLAGTAVFCLLAGAVYTINDLVDVEADRIHPVKRFRPIASGAVPENLARAAAVGLVVLSLGLALVLDKWFALIALTYFIENILYSFKLKNVAYLDVGLIAFGFVLRVVAGGYATRRAEQIHVSGYMLACTALLALFLGFGKRRHELAGEHAGKQRAALKAYSTGALNVALSLTGAATAVTYIAYTLDHETQEFFHSKFTWLTAPFVVFGIVRFLMLVSGRAGRGKRAESPTQEMLHDVPFVLDLVVWGVIVAALVYRLRPG